MGLGNVGNGAAGPATKEAANATATQGMCPKLSHRKMTSPRGSVQLVSVGGAHDTRVPIRADVCNIGFLTKDSSFFVFCTDVSKMGQSQPVEGVERWETSKPVQFTLIEGLAP